MLRKLRFNPFSSADRRSRVRVRLVRTTLFLGSAFSLSGCSLHHESAVTLADATVIARGSRFALKLPGAGANAPLPVFIPWGFNYDRTVIDGRDVLLEAVLRERPDRLDADFAAMRALGGNVIRVFVATGEILNAPGTIDLEAVRRLDFLLATARKRDLRLIIVGLANIEPAAAPAWMHNADDETMDRAETLFWQTVARRCRGNPAVFAYDLQNEPAVHWADSDEWTKGCFNMPSGPKFCYVHFHCRRIQRRWTQEIHRRFAGEDDLRRHWPDYPRPGESWKAIAVPPFDKKDARFAEYFAFQLPLLGEWAARLAAVVRSEDPDHLLTVGALNPPAVASAVDFHSFHLYPEPVPAGQDYLAANARRWSERLAEVTDGKPVIIEEFYPLGLPAGIAPRDLLRACLDATSSRANGWVSFYWGSPERLNWPHPIFRQLHEDWLKLWAEAGANMLGASVTDQDL